MTTTRPTGELPAPSWQNGLAVAGLAGIASFQPSLLPRSRTDQGIVTGGSLLAGFAAGYAVDKAANLLDGATPLDAVGSRLVLCAAGATLFAAATIATHGRPSTAVSALRTAGITTAIAAGTGAALIAERHAAERLDEHLPGGRAAAHAAIFGVAALGAAALILGHTRTSFTAPTGPLPPAQGTAPITEPFDAAHHADIVALRRSVTTTSGGAGSLLPAAGLDEKGVRFVSEVTPAAEIDRVMGVTGARDPIRIYGGMKHGATTDEIAGKVYDEMVRLRAFDRTSIHVYSPSGSGHVNPTAVQANEFLTRGDVASVTIQYNNQPSVKSLGKIGVGRDAHAAILRRITDHVRAMPEGTRPTVNIYAESMGAWSSQDVFRGRGLAGLREMGIDRAMWVGTPRTSAWKPEVLGRAGQTIDATGLVGEVSSPSALAKLPAEVRDRLRVTLLTHLNDPVAKYERSLFVAEPEWLRDAAAAGGVPAREKWFPFVTGLQTMIDAKNATKVLPGYFGASGHDYRAEVAPVLAEAFGHRATEEQLARITRELVQAELARVKVPLPRLA